MSRGRHIATKTRTGRSKWLVLGLVLGLLLAMSIPAGAGGPKDKATGTVTWTARTHKPPAEQLPGLISSFNAHDLGPGDGDKGSYTIYRPADTVDNFPGGSLTMDVRCVKVNGIEAWFAGVVTSADGGYSGTVGNVFLYWVKDVATSGSGGDLIGGRGYDTLSQACGVVDAEGWTGSGIVTGGNLMTHYSE